MCQPWVQSRSFHCRRAWPVQHPNDDKGCTSERLSVIAPCTSALVPLFALCTSMLVSFITRSASMLVSFDALCTPMIVSIVALCTSMIVSFVALHLRLCRLLHYVHLCLCRALHYIYRRVVRCTSSMLVSCSSENTHACLGCWTACTAFVGSLGYFRATPLTRDHSGEISLPSWPTPVSARNFYCALRVLFTTLVSLYQMVYRWGQTCFRHKVLPILSWHTSQP